MLQTYSTAILPMPSCRMDAAVGEDPLIEAAGPIAGAHILILGASGPGLLCDLIRRECLAATSLRASDRPEAAEYDLVLAPSVTPECGLETLVRQTRRALVPTGRLVARVTNDPAGRVSLALSRCLRLNGFRVSRGLVLVADLPGFGLACRG